MEEKLNHQGKPLFTRKGEEVGGGWWVARRGSYSGRVKHHRMPFEHPNYASAKAERQRLADLHPDQTFIVLMECRE